MMKRSLLWIGLVVLLVSGCAATAPPPTTQPTAAGGEVTGEDILVLRFTTEEGELTRNLRVTPDGKTTWTYDGVKKTPSSVTVFVERDGKLVAYGGATPGIDPNAFLIGPGDVLDINVWKNADLTRTVPVRPDGRITLPLIGDIMAAGRTSRQLKDQISTELKRFMTSPPEVTVVVAEVHSYQVFVQGQVTAPGTYPISGTTTLVQVVAVAGGFTQFAATGRITLLRNAAEGTQRYVVDYDHIVSGRAPDVVLRPGDTIIVP
jgi:polysaccharide biosynthesis/export protein